MMARDNPVENLLLALAQRPVGWQRASLSLERSPAIWRLDRQADQFRHAVHLQLAHQVAPVDLNSPNPEPTRNPLVAFPGSDTV